MAKSVQEKIPPRYFSIAAMVSATLLGGWLVWAGGNNPRTYTVSMAINHHSGYGTKVSCQQCHVPDGAFSTSLGCMTGACHGELQPTTTYENAVAIVVQYKMNFPDAEARAKEYIDMHLPLAATPCWECHTEHTSRETKWPKGMTPHSSAALPRDQYVSILKRPG